MANAGRLDQRQADPFGKSAGRGRDCARSGHARAAGDMFLQPILFFAALLWAAALTLTGVFMLFRRASHPVSLHDRAVAFIAMILFALLGGAVIVGVAIILGELF